MCLKLLDRFWYNCIKGQEATLTGWGLFELEILVMSFGRRVSRPACRLSVRLCGWKINLDSYHVNASGPPALPTSPCMCILPLSSVAWKLSFSEKSAQLQPSKDNTMQALAYLKSTGHEASLIYSPTHRDVDTETAFCQSIGCSPWQRGKRNIRPCYLCSL